MRAARRRRALGGAANRRRATVFPVGARARAWRRCKKRVSPTTIRRCLLRSRVTRMPTTVCGNGGGVGGGVGDANEKTRAQCRLRTEKSFRSFCSRFVSGARNLSLMTLDCRARRGGESRTSAPTSVEKTSTNQHEQQQQQNAKHKNTTGSHYSRMSISKRKTFSDTVVKDNHRATAAPPSSPRRSTDRPTLRRAR